ncbi:MAG: cell division protein FtsL [Thermoanaerobaculia bacterium]|nr:cell division protein FtsL [Thermoanaerobaculia bacterium]
MKTPYTTAREVRNRYLVRVRDRKRLRELARVAVAVLLVGAALLGYTWLHLRLLEGGYRVEQLQGRLHELERLERHLRLEAAYLASPQRIEARAVEELGMTQPGFDQMIFVSGDGP